MARFDDVAKGYGKRTPYDPLFFERLADGLGLTSDSCILDIATGTGVLADGLSGFVRRVIGLDQSAAMIAEARSRDNVQLLQHDLNATAFRSEEVCDHAVIGRAIHHLDRDRLGETLRYSLAPSGTVAICSSGFDGGAEWYAAYELFRHRFTQNDRKLSGAMTHAQGMRKLVELGYVPGGRVESTVERSYSRQDLFEHALSYSSCRETLLQRQDDAWSELGRLVDRFGDQQILTCGVISWAQLFRKAP